MEKSKNSAIGIQFGLIIGLIYCVLIFWRWNAISSMITFGAVSILGYLIILGILLYEAFYIRKLNGGFIEFKDVFLTLFISVIIFELFCSLFNLVYMKWIDPDVIEKMKASVLSMLNKYGDKISDKQRNDSLVRIDKMNEQMQISKVIIGYLTSVVLSGIFALIFAAIVKKKKPLFDETN